MNLDYEAQTKEFEAVWSRRHQPPYVMDSWTDNTWAKGRTEYITFLIRVMDKHILQEVEKVQGNLVKYDCIDPLPAEYMHLTVKETGCFLVDQKTGEDEYTKNELNRLDSEAEAIIKTYESFDIRLECLNNFNSVVCVEAHDGGIIRSINAELRDKLGITMLRNDPDFLPHMSIAQYKSNSDFEALIRYLEDIRDTEIGVLHVDRVQLIIAHLLIKDRYPRLEILAEYPLKD